MAAQASWSCNSVSPTFNGFVKLTSLDGTSVRIEQGNLALSSAGSAAGVQGGFNDLEVLGFRETKGDVTLDNVRLDDAYTVFGKTLTAPQTEWGKGDLVINGVEIFDSNVKTNTAAKKVEAINNFAGETGVTASLSHRLVFDLSAAYASSASTDTFMNQRHEMPLLDSALPTLCQTSTMIPLLQASQP